MLDHIHALVAYPLGFAISALLIAGPRAAFSLRRSGVVVVIVLAGVFWAALTPLVLCWALRTLELRCPAESLETAASADVLISRRRRACCIRCWSRPWQVVDHTIGERPWLKLRKLPSEEKQRARVE